MPGVNCPKIHQTQCSQLPTQSMYTQGGGSCHLPEVVSTGRSSIVGGLGESVAACKYRKQILHTQTYFLEKFTANLL